MPTKFSDSTPVYENPGQRVYKEGIKYIRKRMESLESLRFEI